MTTLSKTTELFFDDPLLKLGTVGQTIRRIVVEIWSAIFLVGSVILAISGDRPLSAAGIIFLFYAVDRLIHAGRAKKTFSEAKFGERENIASYFTDPAREILAETAAKSASFGGDVFLRLALETVWRPEVREALKRLDVEPHEFKNKLEDVFQKTVETREDKKTIGAEVQEIALASFRTAWEGETDEVTPADFFAALSNLDEKNISLVFGIFEIAGSDFERALIFGRLRRRFMIGSVGLGGLNGEPFGLRHRYMNRAWTARPTPTLDQFSVDFTDLARLGRTGFMIGHESEFRRLVDILARPDRPNALLVGDAGTGKETIVAHLAEAIVKDEVPPPLFDKRLVAVDLNGLLAGAEAAELESRLKKIFTEISEAGNIILYLPEVHNLARTAGAKGLNASQIITPYILSNDFPVIGATQPKEFKQLIDPDSAFKNAFQNIEVGEVSADEAERILTYQVIPLERIYKIKTAYSAVKMAVALAHRYFNDRRLPASASDLLKEALSEATGRGLKRLTGDEVIKTAEERINIPLHRPGEGEKEKLLNLEPLIHERLVDQNEAVAGVSRALRAYRSGLGRKGGPIASFLFVGPTGVGKTELAKILADIQFGSEKMMIRFDMAEYQDKESVNQFIGSADGAVTGALTDGVIEKPYSLILLDEFEKAHPDILNLFLSVLDDGRLTDRLGRVVNFENTIIIATSNAH
ncbi:MAG TPA: AAA family ATPase, partial [Candidatus Tyrphobacter sp.]|nr:AAA family ATPase [Candidatus Tyrphobacter sp.]